jgi:hypothetical protein
MSEDDETTRVIRRKTAKPPEVTPDSEKTVRPSRATKPPPLPVSEAVTNPTDDEKTRVYRSPAAAAATEANVPTHDASSPTVGWLVVMAGPGRGSSMPLGYGMNHMGRSAANRIILDFGDEEISRKTHTTLTFDPRGKKFYLQPGPDATNLTYLGEDDSLKPVLTPTEILGGETIVLGHTKLRFVAFCGSQFSWD